MTQPAASSTGAPRPAAGEVPPYYARYVALVPEGDIIETLAHQLPDTLALVERLDDRAALHRYAEEKWSIKEVLSHVADTERVFGYRLLRIARGDATPLPGFEQDDYVAAAEADARPLAGILAELRAVRAATVTLLRGLSGAAMARRGTASGVELTAGGCAWIIAGHELHHRTILAERYLGR